MTKTQIIEELKKLPRQDAEEVASFLHSQGIEYSVRLNVAEEWEEETLKALEDAKKGINIGPSFSEPKKMSRWLTKEAPKVWS